MSNEGNMAAHIEGKSTFTANASLRRANCVAIGNDLKFLVAQARDANSSEDNGNQFARASIVFLAFYIEALSNAVFCEEEKISKTKLGELEKEKMKTLPSLEKWNEQRAEPIRKLRLAYSGDLETEQDCTGVENLFRVRNEIFAHPEAHSTIQGHNLTKIKYAKDIGLPHFYSDFGVKQLGMLIEETAEFLEAYLNLMPQLEPWLQTQFKLREVLRLI